MVRSGPVMSVVVGAAVSVAWALTPAGASAAGDGLPMAIDVLGQVTREVRVQGEGGPDLRVGGRSLADRGDRVRLLRMRDGQPVQPGALVVMVDGDRLAGRVVGYEPGLDGGQAGAVLRVAVDGQVVRPVGREVEAGVVRVLASQVAAVLWAAEVLRGGGAAFVAGPLSGPGAVRLADGRELPVEAMDWRVGGLRVLGAQGTRELDFEALAAVRWPDRRPDGLGPVAWSDPAAPVQTAVLADGALISCALRPARRVGGLCVVQPRWAAQPLGFAVDAVLAWQFRRADEVALGRLPWRVVHASGAAASLWPVRQDRSVQGTPLLADGLLAGQGLGMHARSVVRFDLPAAAEALGGFVGVDDAVGSGGCAVAAVWVNDTGRLDDRPAWRSGFVTGDGAVAAFREIRLSERRFVMLEVAAGHEGRPRGADPVDIRDQVSWLAPLLRLARGEGPTTAQGLFPGGAQWQVVDPQNRLRVRRMPVDSEHRWLTVLTVGREAVAWTRRVPVGPAAAALDLELVAVGRGAHRLTVLGDGRPLVLDGDRTEAVVTGRTPLAVRVDLTVLEEGLRTIEVRLAQDPSVKADAQSAVAIRGWAVRPMVAGRPDGRPIRPQVPLEVPGAVDEVQRPRVWGRSWPDAVVIGAQGAARTFAVAPGGRRFVAVLAAVGGGATGPVTIEADGVAVGSVPSMGPGDLMRQVDVALPDGTGRVTLRPAGDGAVLVVAAGFMKR